MAGDAKQLDAVTKSHHAQALKFNVSFPEQLLRKNLYKRNKDTGKFNQNYMTQLVKNYRCHPAILKKPSELFYDGLLEAAASKGENRKLNYNEFVQIPQEKIAHHIWAIIYCHILCKAFGKRFLINVCI